MKRTMISGVLAFTVLSVSGQAFAQEAGAAAAAPEAPAAKPIEGSAGLKLFLGGNLWSTPTNPPPGDNDGLGFKGNGGGFGWGTGIYGEVRFIQHLGVELDIGYDNSTLQRKVTFNGTTDVHEKVSQSGPRISLLFKGMTNVPFGRIWLGLGPEFMLPSSTTDSLEADNAQIPDFISSTKKNSTMLAMAFGFVIHAGDKIEVPIELRAAKNLSQESDYAKRVKVDAATQTYDVTVQNSWDFRLGLGVGYRF